MYTDFPGNPRKRVWVPSRIPSPNEGTCFVPTSAMGFHSCIKDKKKIMSTVLDFSAQYLEHNEDPLTQAENTLMFKLQHELHSKATYLSRKAAEHKYIEILIWFRDHKFTLKTQMGIRRDFLKRQNL